MSLLNRSRIGTKYIMTKKKIFSISILTILLVGLVAFAAYFFWQYQLEIKNNPTRELTQLTKEISKLMLLPESAIPTLATVTEKEKLQSQEFFKNAENGDKVLIYISQGKAILYRPSIKKIIEVAPIKQTEEEAATPKYPIHPVTDSNENTESNSEETEKKLVIVLYNGTTTTGITSEAEQLLVGLSFEYEVTDKKVAQKTDYDTTTIIDLNDTYSEQVRELAAKLGANVDTLPEGETKPNGDILIIVGSDLAKP